MTVLCVQNRKEKHKLVQLALFVGTRPIRTLFLRRIEFVRSRLRMMREIKIVRERFDDMVERAIQNQKLIEAGGRRQLLRGLWILVLFYLAFFSLFTLI